MTFSKKPDRIEYTETRKAGIRRWRDYTYRVVAALKESPNGVAVKAEIQWKDWSRTDVGSVMFRTNPKDIWVTTYSSMAEAKAAIKAEADRRFAEKFAADAARAREYAAKEKARNEAVKTNPLLKRANREAEGKAILAELAVDHLDADTVGSLIVRAKALADAEAKSKEFGIYDG